MVIEKKKMYRLKYTSSFVAAHRLKETPSLKTGKCKNLHGHTYFVTIQIETDRLVDGMVIDFGELKEIINQLDHQFLNDFLDNPTTENLSKYIYDKVYEKIKKRISRFSLVVEVKESDNSSITYTESNL
jgi:6-pyruvoyltetrahydropterin/6-carboxytetrahydropterin synthase